MQTTVTFGLKHFLLLPECFGSVPFWIKSKLRLWVDADQHSPSPLASLLADASGGAPPCPSEKSLSHFGSPTQTTYVHLGAQSCLQIQICAQIIKETHKYVATCTCSKPQMNVNSMQTHMFRPELGLCGQGN